MLKSRWFAKFAAVLFCVAASNPVHADFINGSIETGAYTFDGNGAASLPIGSTTITGWTTFGGELVVIRNANNFGVATPFGDKFIDLLGYHDSVPYGGIQQSIATEIGQQYTLSLYLGVNSTVGASGPVAVQVTAGSSSTSLSANPAGPGDIWTLKTFDFTATSSSTLVSIQGLTSTNGQYIGLDNVSVAATVPEPGSLVMLVFTCIGFWAYRRYRRETPALAGQTC